MLFNILLSLLLVTFWGGYQDFHFQVKKKKSHTAPGPHLQISPEYMTLPHPRTMKDASSPKYHLRNIWVKCQTQLFYSPGMAVHLCNSSSREGSENEETVVQGHPQLHKASLSSAWATWEHVKKGREKGWGGGTRRRRAWGGTEEGRKKQILIFIHSFHLYLWDLFFFSLTKTVFTMPSKALRAHCASLSVSWPPLLSHCAPDSWLLKRSWGMPRLVYPKAITNRPSYCSNVLLILRGASV